MEIDQRIAGLLEPGDLGVDRVGPEVLAQLPPRGHGAGQVLPGVAADAEALQADRPLVAKLLEGLEKTAHVEGALVQGLDVMVPAGLARRTRRPR